MDILYLARGTYLLHPNLSMVLPPLLLLRLAYKSLGCGLILLLLALRFF